MKYRRLYHRSSVTDLNFNWQSLSYIIYYSAYILYKLQDAVDPIILLAFFKNSLFPKNKILSTGRLPADYRKHVRDYLDQNYPNRLVGKTGINFRMTSQFSSSEL